MVDGSVGDGVGVATGGVSDAGEAGVAEPGSVGGGAVPPESESEDDTGDAVEVVVPGSVVGVVVTVVVGVIPVVAASSPGIAGRGVVRSGSCPFKPGAFSASAPTRPVPTPDSHPEGPQSSTEPF